MSTFINPDFLLGNKFARELYHESAENLPIIDYHCHLIPQQVAETINLQTLRKYGWAVTITNGAR